MKQSIQLIFFRHGIAADRETFPGPDADRPLTEEGIDKTRKIAEKITPHYPPNLIITSELLRAQQTAELIAVTLKKDVRRNLPSMVTSSLNPAGSWEHWIYYFTHYVLPEVPGEDAEEYFNIYLVGHEPSISSLFAHYIRASEDCVTFKKAGIGIVRLVEIDKGKMLALLTPKLLLQT